MKKLILILLLFATPVMADGLGFSRSGDSTVVTISLNNARDSVWIRFAYGEGAFYDSVKASPIAGTSNKNLKSTKLALDSLGGHYVEALTFTGDAVADTIIGQWYHKANDWPEITAIKGYLDTEISELMTESDSTLDITTQTYTNVGQDLDTYPPATDLHDKLDALNTLVGTWGAGTGPRLCSLYVWNGASALTSGYTRMTSGSTSYTVNISGDGFAVYNLTDATWTGLVYAPGFTQDTIPQTFVITSDTLDTLSMTANTISTPSAPDMVNMYEYTWDIVGDTVVGAKMEVTVNGRPPYQDSAGNFVPIPRKIIAYSDTLGLVQIEVRESATVTDAAGDDITYDIKISKENYFNLIFENRTAPDSAAWRIQ